MDVLMLKPVFKDAIWGGKLLSDFGYKEAGDNAGELVLTKMVIVQ